MQFSLGHRFWSAVFIHQCICMGDGKCHVSVRRQGNHTIKVCMPTEQHSHHKLASHLSEHHHHHYAIVWAVQSQPTLVVFTAQVGHGYLTTTSTSMSVAASKAWSHPHFLIVIVWFVIFCWCRCGGVLACVWWSGRSWTIGAETETSPHVRSLSPRHRMDSYSPPTTRGKYGPPMPPHH